MNQAGNSDLPDLGKRIEGDLLLDGVSRAVYSAAACIYRIEPLGVVLPRHAGDVAETVAFCRERGLPVIARGGGSGLAGQALGRGVIVDFTRYMDAVIEIDAAELTARVQPGITLGSLNAALKPHGLHFPPDPSSGNYASLGGMIANNSSGPHSLKYGAAIDYVSRLHVVADTAETIVAETRPLEAVAAAPASREADLYRGTAGIAARYRPQIAACMPKTSKNSSGYRLDRVFEGAPGSGRLHLQRLFCGSEGTLGIVTEAVLATAAPPRHVELAVLAFRTVQAAADAVPHIALMRPSAIEAMDSNAAFVVRERRAEMARFLPEEAAMLLFVEFDGPERPPLLEQVAALKREMAGGKGLAFASIDAADCEQAMLWSVRKAVLPILYNMPGPRRVVSFIEDVAVPVPAIPRYIAGLDGILKAHGSPYAVFGHAGEGNFHVRPMLNLADPADVKTMASIAEETFNLVLSLGGTVSGEHGDGLARTQFLRSQYGELYAAFEEIKRLFDPAGILNPGKIVAPGQTICDNLKFGPDYAAAKADAARGGAAKAAGAGADSRPQLLFSDGEYERLVDKCHGCGTCRTLTAETSMCPVYKTLRDERLSPRGKMAALREMLAGRVEMTPAARAQLDTVLELCLNCGMCTAECPVLAEVPLLINDARARRSLAAGVPLLKKAVSMYPGLSKPMPGLVTKIGSKLLEVGLLRRFAEKAVGLDRRRRQPAIRPARGVRPVRVARPRRTAALFADLYASLHDPEIIRCTMAVLEHNEVDTAFPPQKDVGIVAMTAGDRAVRKVVEYNVRHLAAAAAEGRAIVCTEPTASLCLRRDYRRYTADPAAAPVAAACRELFEFLREMKRAGQLKADFAPLDEEYVYHTPCHLAAQGIGLPAVEILAGVPGLRIKVLPKRCCGMAGSFGVDARHYDLASQIGAELFNDIRASGLPVLTECSSCRMQIEEQLGVRVVHPVFLLHRAYGLSLAAGPGQKPRPGPPRAR